MGTPSYVEQAEVRVLPGKSEELKKLLEQKKAEAYYDLIKVRGEKLSFRGLNGCKIISYWYKDFCRFLKDIAGFVEGWVLLHCADPEEGSARLVFKDGKVGIEICCREWETYTPDDLIREKGR